MFLSPTYLYLSTTFGIPTGNSAIKIQANVVDKRLSALIFLLLGRGWRSLLLIGFIAVLGVIG